MQSISSIPWDSGGCTLSPITNLGVQKGGSLYNSEALPSPGVNTSFRTRLALSSPPCRSGVSGRRDSNHERFGLVRGLEREALHALGGCKHDGVKKRSVLAPVRGLMQHRKLTAAVLSQEREVETNEEKGGSSSNVLKPLKPRGSITLGEQQIASDPYEILQDSDSDSDREMLQTKRRSVYSDKETGKAKKRRSRLSEPNTKANRSGGAEERGEASKDDKVRGNAGKVSRNRVGRSLQRANGAVRTVRDKSEGLITESVTRLTDAFEKVVGKGRIAGVPVARIVAKGVSGAVKGGAAASMAESVGMHVGGGAIEVAALRGALTGAVADIVSLFIDPPAQELGEDAVEKGEQAAEELEARLKTQSGGTVIIRRDKTTDGRMGKILGVEKKKGLKKGKRSEGKRSGDSEKGGSSRSENEGVERDVRSDETASEGVKEEGMVWGQMEERHDTTTVKVVGNAVDLGAKAISGAMKGAIWGAAQEASNQGFVLHGAAKGAISGAFGDTIASRVDPLAKKGQESINGRAKEGEEKGTIRRKVKGDEEKNETKVMKKEVENENGTKLMNGTEENGTKVMNGKEEGRGGRKEDEVVEVFKTQGGREVRVKSGARLHVISKTYRKQRADGSVEEVPFPVDSSLGGGKETAANKGGEEEEVLAAVNESFEAGLEAIGDDVIPQRRAVGDDVASSSSDVSTSDGVPRDREPGTQEGEMEESEARGGVVGGNEPSTKKMDKQAVEVTGEHEAGNKQGEKEQSGVTGVQLARARSKSIDGLKVQKGHGNADLVFESGLGGSNVVIDNPRLAEKIEAEEGVGFEVEGEMDNPILEQLSLLKEKGVQMRKEEKGFWTEEQQAEVEKTALRKLTRALGGAVKGAATGAMTEMATTGTISGIGAVKGAVGGAVADLAADVADPIAEQVGKDSDSEEDADADADVQTDVGDDVDANGKGDGEGKGRS